MHTAGFVRTVLTPHHAIDAEFGECGNASEGGEDALVFVRREAVFGDDGRRDFDCFRRRCSGLCGCGHYVLLRGWKHHCLMRQNQPETAPVIQCFFMIPPDASGAYTVFIAFLISSSIFTLLN